MNKWKLYQFKQEIIRYNRIGLIYFISNNTLGPIKIGFTKNLEQRMKALRSKEIYENEYGKLAYCELEVIRTIKPASMSQEMWLHRFFKERSIKPGCDWYEPCWAMATILPPNSFATLSEYIHLNQLLK